MRQLYLTMKNTHHDGCRSFAVVILCCTVLWIRRTEFTRLPPSISHVGHCGDLAFTSFVLITCVFCDCPRFLVFCRYKTGHMSLLTMSSSLSPFTIPLLSPELQYPQTAWSPIISGLLDLRVSHGAPHLRTPRHSRSVFGFCRSCSP